jgi:hypothetical protein
MEGIKFDGGKPQWSLLPIAEVEQIVKVLTMGAVKYAPYNWKIVPDAEKRYEDAMMRHYADWKKGEPFDKDSGESHLAHMACNLLFLMWFENQKRENEKN